MRLHPLLGAFIHAAYKDFIPKKIGRNNTATSGSERVADSSGLRIMIPHLPPVRCWQHQEAQ